MSWFIFVWFVCVYQRKAGADIQQLEHTYVLLRGDTHVQLFVATCNGSSMYMYVWKLYM
jgi:hypothetical protein